jgi:hypothetical protein
MRYRVLFFIALVVVISSCKNNTTEPSDSTTYHAEITFYSDTVKSLSYNHEKGVSPMGISTNWSQSQQNYSLDFENNQVRYITDTSTFVLNKVDSAHVMLTMEPRHLTVVCDTQGSLSYGLGWLSDTESYSGIYPYYKVGTILQEISARVTIKQ